MRKQVLIGMIFTGIALIALGIRLIQNTHREENILGQRSSSPESTFIPSLNIVFIVMDALRFDQIGATRNDIPLTPFLNAIKQQAMVFENAITPCTWTRPAMASIFTSLYVDTHQVYYGSFQEEDGEFCSDALSEKLTTMATFLQSNGYHTIGIQGNSTLSRRFGFDRGFDVYLCINNLNGTDATTKAIMELENCSDVFFLYVHYMDTHAPYNPPEEYQKMLGWPPEGLSREEESIALDFMGYFFEHCKVMTERSASFPYPFLSEVGKDAVRLLYDGETRYMDDEVERLVKHIQSKWPNTLFILTADHGEHFWDHGHLGHGLTMFNCELRVPLFFMGPGAKPGPISHPVELLDILPTVAEILHLAPLETWQGQSLLRRRSPASPVFSYSRSISPVWDTECETVIYNGKKLILDKHNNVEMLFDWLKDPREQHDLSNSDFETLFALKSKINNQRRKNINARFADRQQTSLNEETQENLRRLGYAE